MERLAVPKIVDKMSTDVHIGHSGQNGQRKMSYVMTKDEYLSALKELGISNQRAAWLFNGKSERSGRRWAREGAPFHVALIIALMQEFELTPEHIEALGRQWRNQEEDDAEENEA